MVKMFFNEYSMGIRENFKDVHDVRTFSKICLDTYRNKLQGQTQAEGNSMILLVLQKNQTTFRLDVLFRIQM